MHFVIFLVLLAASLFTDGLSIIFKKSTRLHPLYSSFLGSINDETFELKMNRIAIDYGPRLIGMASSIGRMTKADRVLQNNGNLTYTAEQILHYAKRSGAIEILVGLPLDSNGRMSYKVRNFNGNLCLNFSSVLAAVVTNEIPRAKVKLVDERYTTREAKARIQMDGLTESLDAMSARCLLDRYIEDEGGNSLDAQACEFPVPFELESFDYGLVKRYIEDTYYKEPTELQKKSMEIKFKKEGGSRGYQGKKFRKR